MRIRRVPAAWLDEARGSGKRVREARVSYKSGTSGGSGQEHRAQEEQRQSKDDHADRD
jgi:hypothetical protein